MESKKIEYVVTLVSRQTFTVTISHCKSLKQMIEEASKMIDRVHLSINDKNFPLSGGHKNEGVVLELLEVDKKASEDEILKIMKKIGLKPAKVEHLVALIAQHSQIDGKTPIIAFGSVFSCNKYFSPSYHYPYFHYYRYGRQLDLTAYVSMNTSEPYRWDPKHLFLGVRTA